MIFDDRINRNDEIRIMSKEKSVRNTVSFPIDMYEQIKKLAEDENRSISQQIIHLCKLGLKQSNID